MKRLIILLLTASLILGALCGCENSVGGDGVETSGENTGSQSTGNEETTGSPASGNDGTTYNPPEDTANLGDGDTSFGDSLDSLNAYDGYFAEDTVDITVKCVSGTEGCYTLEGGTLTFTAVNEDSVYSVSGKLKGNIVIDIGDDYKFDIELQGLSLVSDTASPIVILSGNEVSVTAKSETENFIYDKRQAVDESDETVFSGAIYSKVDLEICGKGSLTLVSENNNGIHGKDDLQVKNLTLLVACVDNALKGNDSVEIKSGTTVLIASKGDGIKTTNSDISEKGNQRGTVTVSGGVHTVYAACDGIDAAYDVVIDGDETVLNIYTDKYSNYSSEVTAVDENVYYIRFTSGNYSYSVKYYNSDDDYKWVNAEYHSTVSGSRSKYYYYSFPKMSGYTKMQFFIYSSEQAQGQEDDCLVSSDYLTVNTGCDTFALTSQGGRMSYQWTNYTTTVNEGGFGGFGGFGGMGEGNSDKSEYSTKGVKAGNEITVNAGTLNIKSYDDAIHANSDTALENGETPVGNVTVKGGAVTVYSNDDGLHADGTLTIEAGSVCVINSYEGLEGTNIVISGGNVSVASSDDGINGTATTGTAIGISGGTIYINCTGDGIDSNSRTSYKGIVFSGGKTVVISNSTMNSAIDTEQGYEYTGGSVVAIMPSRGMTSETTHCQNCSGVASSGTLSLSSGDFLTVTLNGQTVTVIKLPVSVSATVIYLGSKSASIKTSGTSSLALDGNGVYWNS